MREDTIPETLQGVNVGSKLSKTHTGISMNYIIMLVLPTPFDLLNTYLIVLNRLVILIADLKAGIIGVLEPWAPRHIAE